MLVLKNINSLMYCITLQNLPALFTILKNSRQEILAEINALKIMVFDLWETHYGEVETDTYDAFKKNIIKKMKNN